MKINKTKIYLSKNIVFIRNYRSFLDFFRENSVNILFFFVRISGILSTCVALQCPSSFREFAQRRMDVHKCMFVSYMADSHRQTELEWVLVGQQRDNPRTAAIHRFGHQTLHQLIVVHYLMLKHINKDAKNWKICLGIVKLLF